MTAFSSASTTDEVTRGIDLTGKQAVVTGCSSGLGEETARSLAAAGAAVTMVARDAVKLENAVAGLRAVLPAAQIDSVLIDLADLNSVRRGAAVILSRCPQINLLINNAGVMACPLMRTAQGFEMQFGTNHVGHFLLTCLLAPALVAGAPARVVNLSSAGHKFAAVDMDDPNYLHRPYEKWAAYGQSKTANVLFSVALDQRLRYRGVRAFAVHPGVIITELSRYMEDSDWDAVRDRRGTVDIDFKTLEQGAATSVWAATAPALEGRGGLYLEDCQVAAAATPGSETGVEDFAVDSALAEQLWQLSESLVGEQFSL